MANLDERLHDDMQRAVDPAPDEDALFGDLSRRRDRRRLTRRIGTGALAIAVVVASIGGFLILTHVFRERTGPADTTMERNGAIIYSSTYGPDGSGDLHLWIADPDGSNATQLTTGSGVDVEAAVSPDGRRVAFIRLDQVGRFGKWSLWTTTLAGDERQLTDPINQGTQGLGYPQGLSFSPDGSRIAIDTGVFGPYGIWTVAVDGSDPQLVGATDEIPVSGASWSPDGRSIVYAGSPTASGFEGPWDLYVVDVDAAADDIGRPITSTVGEDELDPSWSPDGRTIAFQQTLQVQGQPGTGIGTVASDGSSSMTLAETQGCCLQEPTWAPDGTSLLFVSSDKVASLVQRIAPDGTGRTTVLRGANGPAWQPRPTGEPGVPSPTASATARPVADDCMQSSVKAPFEGDAEPDGTVRIHCDAAGDWRMDIEWGQGATGSWPLTDICAGPCLPYATPDVNGDGRAELLLWSRDDDHPLGYVVLFDMNPSEISGVPVSVRDADGAPMEQKFAVGVDDRQQRWIGCQAGAFSWNSVTERADGRWDEQVSLFDFASGRTSADPGLRLQDVTHRTVDRPDAIQSQVCGAPILLGGAGVSTANVPAEHLGGVPFPACDVSLTALRFGSDAIGAAVVFSKATGDTCQGPGSDWYLGVSEDLGGDALEAFAPIVGCAPRCWAYSAFETFDTDGAWDVAVGIRPSNFTIRLYDVGTGPGDWHIRAVMTVCAMGDCSPFEYRVAGSESGEGSGLSCHVEGGKPTGLVLWSRGAGGASWDSAQLVFEGGTVRETGERHGSGYPPANFEMDSLESCSGAITSDPPYPGS